MTKELPSFDSDPTAQKEPAVTEDPSLEQEQAILEMYLPYHEHSLDELRESREWSKVFIIEFGSKTLLVYLNNETSFKTILVNNGKQKISGDTTVTYTKARQIMQKEADLLKKNLSYHESTADAKMAKWAKANGNEIFHWEEIVDPQPYDRNWLFNTTIFPN